MTAQVMSDSYSWETTLLHHVLAKASPGSTIHRSPKLPDALIVLVRISCCYGPQPQSHTRGRTLSNDFRPSFQATSTRCRSGPIEGWSYLRTSPDTYETFETCWMNAFSCTYDIVLEMSALVTEAGQGAAPPRM